VVPPNFGVMDALSVSLRGDAPALSAAALYAGSADVLPGVRWRRLSACDLLLCPRDCRYCFCIIALFSYLLRVRLGRIISRQSRSPRCKPRISISAVARFVAMGTLWVSQRWIVCISC